MENPGSWNLLTASLAVSDLAQREVAWAFLTNQRLVRNSVGDIDTFMALVQQEIDRGPITGPSLALRVATALQGVGIALPAGDVPDPWGKIAEERLRSRSSFECGT